jgi:hypothetical protein
MLLDLIQWLVGQILADLSYNMLRDFFVEGPAKVCQRARRRDYDKRLSLASSDDSPQRAYNLTHEFMLFKGVPVRLFNGEPTRADRRMGSSWTLSALLMRAGVFVLENPHRLEVQKDLVALIAEYQRLSAIADKYVRIMGDGQLGHYVTPLFRLPCD